MAEPFRVEGNSEFGASQSSSGCQGSRVLFPHFQIEVCSRVCLSRNLATYPFFDACSNLQRHEIGAELSESTWFKRNQARCQIVNHFTEQSFLHDLRSIVGLRLIDAADQTSLTLNELQRISESDEQIRWVLNTEDHLQIEIEDSGTQLTSLWQQVSEIDDQLQSEFGFAFHPQYGFLTASPANVGTGLRASALLHLPATISMGTFPQLQACLSRQNVAIRESFGVPGAGDFFRISNHSTLGISEDQLVLQVVKAVTEVVEAEQDARAKWSAIDLQGLKRELNLAMSELESIDFATLDFLKMEDPFRWKMIGHISKMRLGLQLGLLHAVDGARIAGRFQRVQLQSLLSTAIANEDYRTASRIRDRIKVLGEAG